MKLSTKGKYGLRAFVDLAVHSGEEPVSLSGIAARQEISLNYLEQLMAKLKRAKLVESVRGVNGGYVLAKPAEEISVGDVLRALEGDLSPVDCVAFDDQAQCGCGISSQCSSRMVWQKISDSINETVDNIWVGQLVNENKERVNTNIA